MHPRFRIPSAAAAIALAASCSSFAFDSQEIALRAAPGEDALDVLIVYEGVHPDGSQQADLDRALHALQENLAGRRRLILFGWPFELDLDSEELADSEDSEKSPVLAELERRIREYSVHVALDDAGLARDGERLTMHQRFRMKEPQAGFALLNDLANALVLEELGEEDAGEESEGELDARTRELWLAAARADHRWFAWDDAGLVLSLPMSEAGAALLVKEMAAAMVAAGREETEGHLVLDALSSVSLEDELLVARFAPDDADVVRFIVPRRKPSGEPELIEALEAAGIAIDGPESLQRARRAFTAP